MTKPKTKNDSLYDTAHGELAAAGIALRKAKRTIGWLKNASECLVRFDIDPVLTQITLLSECLDDAQREENRT